jgi:hypothetical protein
MDLCHWQNCCLPSPLPYFAHNALETVQMVNVLIGPAHNGSLANRGRTAGTLWPERGDEVVTAEEGGVPGKAAASSGQEGFSTHRTAQAFFVVKLIV